MKSVNMYVCIGFAFIEELGRQLLIPKNCELKGFPYTVCCILIEYTKPYYYTCRLAVSEELKRQLTTQELRARRFLIILSSSLHGRVGTMKKSTTLSAGGLMTLAMH